MASGTNVGMLFATLEIDTKKFNEGMASAGTKFLAFGRGLSTGAAYAAAGSAALQGVGGAAMAIASIVPAAALAIPAVVGLGTAMFGLKGVIGDAFGAVKAYGQAQGGASQAASQAVQAAHSLTQAQWGLTSAQEGLNAAIQSAKDNLEELQKTADRASTTMAKSALGLKEAQEHLADVQRNGTSSNDQIEEAQLAVQEAQYAYDDQTESIKKNQVALKKAQTQGVDGNQQVVDAVHQLTQAQWALADAQKKALNPSGPNAFSQAMAKLPPLAQQFVRTLISFKPQMDAVRKAGSNVFPGMTSAVKNLATNFPVVTKGVKDMATNLSTAADGAGKLLSGASVRSDLGRMMDANAVSMGNFAGAIAPVLRGLISIGAVAAPILEALSGHVGKVANGFMAWASETSKSGQMTGWIATALLNLKTLGQVVKNVVGGLFSLFKGIGSSGAGTLNVLLDVSKAFRSITTNTTLQGMIKSLGSAFSGMLGAALKQILSLVTALMPSLQALVPSFTQLMPIFLLFAKGKFSPLMMVVGIFTMLGPLMGTLTPALQQLVGAFTVLSNAAGSLFTAVLGAVVKALIPLIPLVAKVATQLAGGLATAIVGLEPAFTQLAGVIVMLMPALAQLMPSILKLVFALLPLVPLVANVAAQVITDLVPAVLALVPVVVPVINTLARLVGAILRVASTSGAIKALAAVVIGAFIGIKLYGLLPEEEELGTWLALQLAAWASTAAAAVLGAAAMAIGFLSMIAGWIATAAAALAGAIATAAAWLIAIAPIALVIAAVALVAFLIYKYWNDIVKWTEEAWHAVSHAVSSGVGWVVDEIKKLPGLIERSLVGLVEILTWPYRTAFNLVGDLWNRSIGSLHITFPSWVPGIGGKGIDMPKLPRLANGGVIGAGGGLAVVGDGGEPEIVDLPGGASVTPLSRMGRGGGISMTVIHNGPIYDRAGLDLLAAKLAVPLRVAINRHAASNGGSTGFTTA